MRYCWLVTLFASSACNAVFVIEPTALRNDASPPPDLDQDGVTDGDDNCPTVGNDQADEDEDGRGDICDNCVLIANPDQAAIGDRDAVGDACDAHPETDGDCFIFADTFRDPASFALRWNVVLEPAGTLPVITPRDGVVDIAPVDAFQIAVAVRDPDGVFSGVFDVVVIGRITLTTGSLLALSNLSSPRSGVGCGVGYIGAFMDARGVFFAGSASTGSTITSPFDVAGEQLGADALIRLMSPSAVSSGLMRCRLDYAVAVGVQTFLPSQAVTPTNGTPGVRVQTDPVTLAGIAAYRYQPNTECPVPIIR